MASSPIVRIAHIICISAQIKPPAGRRQGSMAAISASVESRDYVEALARGLSVMKAFREQSDRLTLSDVARLTGLSRASVRRSLLTLGALGYAESSGRYFSLSPQVLTLAQAYLSSSPVPRVAQSFLEKASET